jgi:cytochrome oxidase Cu insertion factor (SCO1/SenC/PrrC family)
MRPTPSGARYFAEYAMRRFSLAGFLVVAALLLGVAPASASRWGKEYVPNVPVVTQDGTTLHFYDDLVKDKIVVISFIYTSCKDICPLATARLGEAQEKLGDRVGRDIFFLSVSIDPEHDTPDRLKQYADAFHAGPGWLFLTGLPEDIQEIRYKFGDRRPDVGDHRNDVVLGNGTTGEWQRENALGDIDHFVGAVEAMDPNWRARPHALAPKSVPAERAAAGPAPAAVPFDTGYIMEGRQAGSAMFAKLCAGCHTIGKGDRVGPDLDGLTARRSRAWITDFLMDPIKMRARKDPIALALAAKYPGVRMPYLQLHESDAGDLISYINAHSTKRAPVIGFGPLMALTTQDGAHLKAEELTGKPFAVVFGYTHCPDVCPTTLLEWTNLLQSVGPAADKFRLLFVSVDGERDTPAVLKSYMTSFDRRITALTGTESEVAAVLSQFGAHFEKVPGKGGDYTVDHSVKSYLIDQNARLSGTIDPRLEESQQRRALSLILAE